MAKKRQKRKRRCEVVLECNQLRFSQEYIMDKFQDGSSLDELILELEANTDYAFRLQPLRIFKSGGHYVSLDNRRLACLHEASRFLGVALRVPCILYSKRYISKRMSSCQNRKLNFYYSKPRHRGAFVQLRVSRSPFNCSKIIRVWKNKESPRYKPTQRCAYGVVITRRSFARMDL